MHGWRRVGENEELHLGLENGAVRGRVRCTMNPAGAKTQSRIHGFAGISAIAGVVLFQFFGNASRGYVDTPSLFWWWISQWIDPQAETEHGWLILGLSLWLFWRNLKLTGAAEPVRSGPLSRGTAFAPLVALVVALGLHALGFVAQQSRISIVALLIFIWAVLAMTDRRWARAALFPLGFMLFAVPLNVLDSVGFWLRLGVIDATAALARGAGLEVVRSGTQLFAPDGSYQYDVAAACSGVRSLMALSALSLLMGYLNFRSTVRRGLMLLVCFPLTYLGNITRVVLIIVAAEMGGQAWGARVHEVMGYGVFLIVLGGVWGTVALVRRIWPEKGNDSIATRSNPTAAGAVTSENQMSAGAERGSGHGDRWPARWASMTVVLVTLEIVGLWRLGTLLHRGAAGVQLGADGTNPVELPAFLGTEWVGRRAEVSRVERETLPADTGFSRRTYVSVQDRSHTVFLSIVLSGRDRTSIHRPEICLVGQGWSISEPAAHAFIWEQDSTRSLPATLLRTTLIEPVSQRKIQALVAYWFVGADVVVATHWQRFLHDAWNRVRHGRVDRWAYVLVQTDAEDGDAAAVARIQTILNATLPAFQRVDR